MQGPLQPPPRIPHLDRCLQLLLYEALSTLSFLARVHLCHLQPLPCCTGGHGQAGMILG